MPVYIDGRVEFLDLSFDLSEKENDSVWASWLDLGSLIRFNDEVNHFVMGNPRALNDEFNMSLAKNRGFPSNPGYVSRMILKILNVTTRGCLVIRTFTMMKLFQII